MVRGRTTGMLLAAAVLLAAVIWWGNREGDRRGNLSGSVGDPVLPIRFDAVSGLSYQVASQRVECVKQEGVWLIRAPVKAPVRHGGVDAILSYLESIRCKERIQPDQRIRRDLTLDDYGLVTPRARIVVVDDVGAHELIVGDDTPLGTDMYVKVGSQPGVIVAEQGLLDVLPADHMMLRDRRIFSGLTGEAVRIDIHRREKGFVQLQRGDAGWALQQPFEAAADEAQVRVLLRRLYELEVLSFVWDPPTDWAVSAEVPTEASATAITLAETHGLGIDEAALRIEVWLEGDLLSRELILSAERTADDEGVYARRRDIASIYTVPLTFVEALSIDAEKLRSREVFSVRPSEIGTIRIQQGEHRLVLARNPDGSWQLLEPTRAKADRELVRGLVDMLRSWRAVDYPVGVDSNVLARLNEQPAMSIQLIPGVATNPVPEVIAAHPALLIDAPAEGKGETGVMAVLEGDDRVFELPQAVLQELPPGLMEGTPLRDLTVLAIDPVVVRSLTLTHGEREFSVAREDSGHWTTPAGMTNGVDVATIDGTLALLSGLRALRIEAVSPGSLEPYGLDDPGLSVTVGLKGDQGIQTTLLIGYRARTDGFFAHVRGWDIVFVLSNEIVDLLSSQFVIR